MKKHLRQITTNALYAILIANSACASNTSSLLDTSQTSQNAISKALSEHAYVRPKVMLDPKEVKSEIKDVLDNAKCQVIISSPFISKNAIGKYGLGISDKLEKKKKFNTEFRSLALLSKELTHSKPHEVGGIKLLQETGVKVTEISQLHAKYILVDEHILLIGSFNFLSGSLDPKNQYYLLNMIMRIEAPYIEQVLPHCYYIADEKGTPVPLTRIHDDFDVMSSVLDIVRTRREMINGATSTLEICSPYLSQKTLEDSGYLELMKKKVLEGVHVTVYVDTKSGLGDTQWAVERKTAEFKEVCELLFKAGIHVVKKHGIHCKWIIQDNRDLYFGSDNMLGNGADEGTWRELGVRMLNAEDQIAEIRTQMATVETKENANPIQTSDANTSPMSSSTKLNTLTVTQQTAPIPAPALQALPVVSQAIPKVIAVNVAALPVTPLYTIKAKSRAIFKNQDDSSDDEASEDEDDGISVGSSSDEEIVTSKRAAKPSSKKTNRYSSDDDDFQPKAARSEKKRKICIESDEELENSASESANESESDSNIESASDAGSEDGLLKILAEYIKTKEHKKKHKPHKSHHSSAKHSTHSSSKHSSSDKKSKHVSKKHKTSSKEESSHFEASNQEPSKKELKRLKKGSKS